MQSVDINDVAAIGAVQDVPPYMLPPEAWTTALNMRAVDRGLQRMLGWESVFGTPSVAPHFLMPISSTATNFWLYASLTKIYGYDGVSHTNITRQTAAVDVDYTVSAGQNWNGTLLGGIPILNNGTDVPQFWATPALATKMADLTNWTATMRAKVVRAFGPFLMAFNVTDSGTNKPHLVRWSHPAVPGSVPASWDTADASKDAGEVDLPDTNAGIILDALPLSSNMFIYKENSIHRARYVGGRAVFDFGEAAWLPSLGLLSARCVATTGDGLRHVFASQDDLMWHNGNQVKSLLNKKQKKRLANELDTSNFNTSFLFANPYYGEIWFCYPSSGQSFPDKALILNYSEGEEWTITEADGITFRHAASGLIEAASAEVWADNPSETWDQDTGPWSTLERSRVVAAGTASTKIFKLDSSVTRDGSAFSATLQREGLSVVGRKRTGEWIVDHQAVKLLDRLWPKIQGGPVNIRVGVQEQVNGPVSWGAAVSFDPSAVSAADILPMAGRALSVEFSTTASVSWRLDGYKLEIEVIAEH